MSFMDQYKAYSGYNMFDSMMHPERGYEQGEKAVKDYWDEAKGYMQPYQQAGAGEIDRLRGASDDLMNPEQMENRWASGYQISPHAQQMMERSKNMGMDAASSMGLEGSSAALENIQNSGTNLMNADRDNYMNRLMQKYQLGVQNSQNMFNTGAGTANAMGQGAMQTGNNIAQMRYGAANAPGEMGAKFAGIAARAAMGAA